MRDFNSYPVEPYIGQPYGQPVSICGNAARVVPLYIDWFLYDVGLSKPNLGIVINLQQGVREPIREIQSVYIDNTDSLYPIFVYFPDTGFVAVAAPNDTVFSPVITNGVICVIYGLGFTDDTPPKTRVFLCDTAVPTISQEEVATVYPQHLASPTIQRNNILTPGFAPPALGDQLITHFLLGQSATNRVNLFPTGAYDFNFIYLTSLNIYGAGIQGGPTQGSVKMLQDNSIEMGHFRFWCPSSPINITIFNQTNLQVRLSTQSIYEFKISDVWAQGGIDIIATFCVNDR